MLRMNKAECVGSKYHQVAGGHVKSSETLTADVTIRKNFQERV